MLAAPSHTCVATLGGQPQVVTLALDALLARGYPISEVIVVHLSPRDERYRASLARLATEFAGDHYRGRQCRYRRQPVLLGTTEVADLRGETETDATLNTLHALLLDLKRADTVVHLCIAGGRRLLGLLALAAALLYFDHADRVWHLHSSDPVRRSTRDGAVLHLPDHPDVRLVRVSVPPWGQYFPALRVESGMDAATARQTRTATLDAAERTRCAAVYAQLTPRRREVLRALAADRTPQEVAEDLRITLSTVNDHKTAIFQECLNVWDLPPTTRLGYDWLRRKFAPFIHEL